MEVSVTPSLSTFYGIAVRMQSEKRQKHNKPHIHTLYGDDEIVVGIDGEILEGTFPNKQMKLLLAWIAIHEEELRENWMSLSNGMAILKLNHCIK